MDKSEVVLCLRFRVGFGLDPVLGSGVGRERLVPAKLLQLPASYWKTLRDEDAKIN